MKILTHGEVTLVDSMGNDLSVVQGARISNGAALPEWRDGSDDKLIRFLAEHGHTSPFEHVTLKFYVKAPIFVLREWMRHRTLSYNEMSARYTKLRPEFWLPDKVRIPDPRNKQSSVEVDGQLESVHTRMTRAYDVAWYEYEEMLLHGVAREMARSVLPVGIYSEMIVSGNLLNWMRFYKLRATAEAQQEIRAYAYAIGDLIGAVAPESYAALRRNL